MSVSGRNDGTIEAMYIQILDCPVARTEEIRTDVMLADYAADGRLVGIEVLSPVRFADVEALVSDDQREPFRRFMARTTTELVTK